MVRAVAVLPAARLPLALENQNLLVMAGSINALKTSAGGLRMSNRASATGATSSDMEPPVDEPYLNEINAKPRQALALILVTMNSSALDATNYRLGLEQGKSKRSGQCNNDRPN